MGAGPDGKNFPRRFNRLRAGGGRLREGGGAAGRAARVSRERAYLDHNATTALRPQAREAMARALAVPGNASSIHAEGRAARALVEDARRVLAETFGGPASGVTFASGGTEALNLALSPTLEIGGRGFDLLLMGAGEHAAVLAGHRFPAEAAETVALTPDGALDLGALAAAPARSSRSPPPRRSSTPPGVRSCATPRRPPARPLCRLRRRKPTR